MKSAIDAWITAREVSERARDIAETANAVTYIVTPQTRTHLREKALIEMGRLRSAVDRLEAALKKDAKSEAASCS